MSLTSALSQVTQVKGQQKGKFSSTSSSIQAGINSEIQSFLLLYVTQTLNKSDYVSLSLCRDVSALHYDPSSESHAAMETMTETPKKERSVALLTFEYTSVDALLISPCLQLLLFPLLPSKAARRKKRQEAKQLPEVSKDIYYDVTMDLKEAFGTVKEIQKEKKEVSWDLDDDENIDSQVDMAALSFSSNQESEPSSGFKFSFFEDDAETKTTKTTGEPFLFGLRLIRTNASLLKCVDSDMMLEHFDFNENKPDRSTKKTNKG